MINRSKFLTLAVVATSAVLAGATSNFSVRADPIPKTKPPTKLAFIYKSDKDSAESFKKLLDKAGFSVDLIQIQIVEKTDFASYDATLTGSDTERSWGALSKAVDKSNKPILGLGEGGYSFFGGLKLDIGSPHGAHGPFPNAVPVNAAKSAFWTSTKMSITDEQSVAIYEKTNHVGIYLPNPADDVLLIAREAVGAKHFVMVQKGKRYVFWGFTGSPDQMTTFGKELFVATCKYTTSLK